ncbi:MAG: MFS transporter [Chloroflexi bacterium]|nr:MFS transporter [Chloroflexota bacterium]
MGTPTVAATGSAARLPVLFALRSRGFRLLWTSSLLGQMGRWMEVVVLGWLVLELTNSPLQVALVGFFRWTPSAVLGAFTGMLSDRMGRKRIVIIGAVLATSASGAVTVLVLSGLAQTWHIFVLSFILGTYWALDFPARRALFRDYLDPAHVVSALSLETLGGTISRIVGPIVGGSLISLVGVGGASIGVATVFFLQLLVHVALPRPLRTTISQPGSLLHELLEGVRYARRSQVIVGVLLVTILMNTLVLPVHQLFPVFARDTLQVGPTLLGLLMASEGVGTMIGSAVLAAARQVKRSGAVFALGALGLIVFILLFSLSTWYAVSLLLLFVAGIGLAAFTTLQSALILLGTTDEMRGRVLGLLSLCIGTQFLGFALMGALAAWLSTPSAVAASAALGAVLLLLLMGTNRVLRS